MKKMTTFSQLAFAMAGALVAGEGMAVLPAAAAATISGILVAISANSFFRIGAKGSGEAHAGQGADEGKALESLVARKLRH